MLACLIWMPWRCHWNNKKSHYSGLAKIDLWVTWRFDSWRTYEFWYQLFTCGGLIPIYTDVRIWYQLFTNMSILYQFFTYEKNRTSSSRVQNIEIWKLSTNFKLKKLSNLTVRTFIFAKKWRIGTNSSHGVKFAIQHTKCS